MKPKGKSSLIGLIVIALTFFFFINYFTFSEPPIKDEPWVNTPVRTQHEDHKSLMKGPYQTGQEVTAACLECHKEAAEQVIHTSHWKLKSEPVLLAERDEPVTVGMDNSFNNICIGFQGDWSSCTSCHSGFGWEDEDFDLTDTANVDCLVCHERTGTYKKSNKGLPTETINLTEVAQSVSTPGTENCSGCHYRGSAGIAITHGDWSEQLTFASEDLDVHTGEHKLLCVDCHGLSDQQTGKRSMTTALTPDTQEQEQEQEQDNLVLDSLADRSQLACTNCHNDTLHQDERLNQHTASVACQTCHIPAVEPSKTTWTWSETEESMAEEALSTEDKSEEGESAENVKTTGSFTADKNLIPEYHWYNGTSTRYILGDEIEDPKKPTFIEHPVGNISDPQAKIWPFKVHVANQPFDTFMNTLLIPELSGEGETDWLRALELGAERNEQEFSGEYAFTKTYMYWPATHMVAPKERALQCRDCHSDNGRMSWEVLGYPGDPIKWGTEKRTFVLKNDAKKDNQIQRGTEQ